MGNNDTKLTPTNILNRSYDKDLDLIAVETMEFDPSGAAKRKTTGNLATRFDDAGSSISYIGKATIGSATSDPVWQIQKMDETGGDVVITWADGDDSFNNIWDNRSSLTYN